MKRGAQDLQQESFAEESLEFFEAFLHDKLWSSDAGEVTKALSTLPLVCSNKEEGRFFTPSQAILKQIAILLCSSLESEPDLHTEVLDVCL